MSSVTPFLRSNDDEVANALAMRDTSAKLYRKQSELSDAIFELFGRLPVGVDSTGTCCFLDRRQ